MAPKWFVPQSATIKTQTTWRLFLAALKLPVKNSKNYDGEIKLLEK